MTQLYAFSSPRSPRFRVVLEEYAGGPSQEWLLELDEIHNWYVVGSAITASPIVRIEC
jgi:hypothetical protein